MPAKREVRIDIGTRGCPRFALQSILDRVEGFKVDQWLMMTFARLDIPVWGCDVTSIKRLG
ncbi:MAG: hypothetical protein O9253_01495 [Aquidulcibacter sp.]|nr:hypothetical protein [Aquidulcibacter sp.]